MSRKEDVIYPIKGREDITRLPDGFPAYGNLETLAMMQPVYNRLVCTEKIYTCAVINALTINLKLLQNRRFYNSNFLVMPAGASKTTFLESILLGNTDFVLKTKSKHFESEMYQKNRKDFVGKTWINFDCIPTFTSCSKKQLNQLIDFYTGSLSDGVFGRGELDIQTDYNILYAMASDSFGEIQKVFKGRTFLERVVPLFFYPTIDDWNKIDDKIYENDLHETEKLVLKLPYSEGIDDYDNKTKFVITEEMKDWSKETVSKLTRINGNSTSRNRSYIHNFVASNAFINKRIHCVEGENCVIPDEPDLRMFEWVMEVHSRFPVGSLEGIVFEETVNYGFPVTVPILLSMSRIQEVIMANGFMEIDVMNSLQSCLDDLLNKGLIKKVMTKGIPTFDLANKDRIVE